MPNQLLIRPLCDASLDCKHILLGCVWMLEKELRERSEAPQYHISSVFRAEKEEIWPIKKLRWKLISPFSFQCRQTVQRKWKTHETRMSKAQKKTHFPLTFMTNRCPFSFWYRLQLNHWRWCHTGWWYNELPKHRTVHHISVCQLSRFSQSPPCVFVFMLPKHSIFTFIDMLPKHSIFMFIILA